MEEGTPLEQVASVYTDDEIIANIIILLHRLERK